MCMCMCIWFGNTRCGMEGRIKKLIFKDLHCSSFILRIIIFFKCRKIIRFCLLLIYSYCKTFLSFSSAWISFHFPLNHLDVLFYGNFNALQKIFNKILYKILIVLTNDLWMHHIKRQIRDDDRMCIYMIFHWLSTLIDI